VPVTRVEYPSGVAGVRLSLSEMASRIYEGIRTSSMQGFAEFVVRNWAQVPAQQHLTNRQAAQIFLDFVRAQIRYRPDPPNTELVKSAAITLCVPGAPMCIPVEDCDGLTVAFLTICGAFGIPVRIIKQTYGSQDQEHVLGEIQDDDGTWYPADPSAPGKPLGWKASASHEDVIDPSDPASIGMVGAPEAEFIGVGRVANHFARRHARGVAGMVERGLGRPVGMGLVSLDDVTSFGQQLDPQMVSVNLAVTTCTGLAASDVAAWGGFYASWKILYSRWQQLSAPPWYAWPDYIAAAWGASDMLSSMQQYQVTLASWQQKVKASCSGYSPPPSPAAPPSGAPPLPGGGTVDQLTKVVTSVTGVIIAGTVAYVVVDALGWLDILKPRATR